MLAPNADQQAAQIRRLEVRARELEKAGDITAALKVRKEAVAAWRALVSQEPRFISELARYLSNLSVTMTRLGLHAEAYTAADDSVRFWRAAADEDLARHGFDLSQALMRFAPLAGKFYSQRAFMTARIEATDLLIRLASVDPARCELLAARTCLMIAEGGSFDKPEKALHYAQTAVELWRQLAEKDLIEHGSQLIRALNQLSIEQIDAGGSFGKAPLSEARWVKLARLILRIKLAVRLRRFWSVSSSLHGQRRKARAA